MTYISLAHRNSEIVVISDMDTFANYFCFAKKQKQGHLIDDIKLDEEAPSSEIIAPGDKAFDAGGASAPSDDEEDDI